MSSIEKENCVNKGIVTIGLKTLVTRDNMFEHVKSKPIEYITQDDFKFHASADNSSYMFPKTQDIILFIDNCNPNKIGSVKILKDRFDSLRKCDSPLMAEYEFSKREFETLYIDDSKLGELVYETIPQQLFHISKNDLDDKYGVRLDELTLIKILHDNPEALKYQSLSWFVDYFITSNQY